MSLGLTSTAHAGEKTYEVTGPVVGVCCPEKVAAWARAKDPVEFFVKKGKERVQINIDVNTKMNAQPKVGDLVTVHYMRSPTRFGDDSLFARQIELKAVDSSKK